MSPDLDHVIVAARNLAEGGDWVERRLGVAPVAGGKHAFMGTHNRLLRLGERCYLEVIAIDPEASAPGRPRWFELDRPAMRSRLELGPALIHWAERTPDIERAHAAGGGLHGEILAGERGEYRWRITVPRDGSLPGEGRLPTLIQWEGGRHPALTLPESGCEIVELETMPLRIPVRTPGELEIVPLRISVRTPTGLVTLP